MSTDLVSQAERDVFARALHAQMADMTLDQVVSIITNPYDELIEYVALREGKRACQKTSLLFNPHRLNCVTAKDQRYGSIYRALQDKSFHSGLARASMFRASEMGAPRVGEVFYSTIQIGVNGTQYVNEFPPHVARDLCRKYDVTRDSRVLDPCGGWGGRMIGVSVVADHYSCFEPATLTARGLKNLSDFIRSVNPDFETEVNSEPYEDSAERVGFYDFALTSPPYYDTEHYSDEDTNSCNRYTTFDTWCAGFFLPMVDKTMRQLKSGRPFVINVGDRRYPLTQVLEKHCADRGYRMRRVKGGIMNNAGFGRDADGGEKFYELTVSPRAQLVSTSCQAVEVSKPWQRGVGLAELRSIEDRFSSYNNFARGPYGEMNKRNIADALHRNRLHVTDWGVVDQSITSRATPITAYLDVVLARKQPGDRVVNAFTYDHPDEMTAYLAGFTEPTWVWIWQECQQQKQIVLDAGYEFVGGKITSFAEIRGLYFRDPTGREERRHPQLEACELIGLQRLPITVDVTEAAREIAWLSAPFTNHYSAYNNGKSWSALSLRGYSPDFGLILKPSEMGNKWRADHAADHAGDVFELQDTALRSQLPAVDALHGQLTSIAEPQRIRLMKLTAGGGELGRHTDLTDKESGISDGHVARFHIPIITNDHVTFTSWGLDGERTDARMRAGEVVYLDTRKPHKAANAGADARVHLVVDVKANDAIRSLIEAKGAGRKNATHRR